MTQIPIPVEPAPDPAGYRLDKWLARFKILLALTAGAALGFSGLMFVGDNRYVRVKDLDDLTKSFTAHSTAQQQLETHIAEDRASYATREELARHSAQPGHTSSLDKNRSQDRRIRQLEQAQVWTARALWAIARKQGIQLPPPPVLTPEEPEQP